MKKLLLTMLILMFTQCTLFAPRDSEPPTAGSSEVADSYQKLLTLFESALTSSDPDMAAGLLDNDFSFAADSLDSASLNASFRTWDRSREVLFLRTLLSGTKPLPTNISSTTSIVTSTG
ncbi:MAG: hypothetical protein JNL74_04025, partial [Fibrobacteres bacterium]|nr:hypothetical protein [Fibrobacterota bacterium]